MIIVRSYATARVPVLCYYHDCVRISIGQCIVNCGKVSLNIGRRGLVHKDILRTEMWHPPTRAAGHVSSNDCCQTDKEYYRPSRGSLPYGQHWWWGDTDKSGLLVRRSARRRIRLILVIRHRRRSHG